MSINTCTISGNLTRDPELRATASGTEVLGFSVAVNDRRRNPQTGVWEDIPNYIDCTMFGSRAAALANILHKGSGVTVQGKLRWSQWERDGQKRSKIEVVVDEIALHDKKGAAPAEQAAAPEPEAEYVPYDIPF